MALRDIVFHLCNVSPYGPALFSEVRLPWKIETEKSNNKSSCLSFEYPYLFSSRSDHNQNDTFIRAMEHGITAFIIVLPEARCRFVGRIILYRFRMIECEFPKSW